MLHTTVFKIKDEREEIINLMFMIAFRHYGLLYPDCNNYGCHKLLLHFIIILSSIEEYNLEYLLAQLCGHFRT
jgi:hypothetical protein